MKSFIRHIALLLALVVSSHGEVPQGDFRVTCNGIIHGSPSLGRTMWNGTINVTHPRFLLEVDGQTSLFSGHSLQRKQGASGRLRAKDITFDHDLISLVALGDIKVTVINPGTNTPPISARRFVYIPEKNQILIDGKPWQPEARPPASAEPSAPPAGPPIQ
jgi:hypothetical protein